MYKVVSAEFKDHLNYLKFVFEILENKTKNILSTIRNTIVGEITNQYLIEIDDFRERVRIIIGDTPFAELTNSITKCSTNIQNEIANIAEWFSLSNPSSEMELNIKMLIQTALKLRIPFIQIIDLLLQ